NEELVGEAVAPFAKRVSSRRSSVSRMEIRIRGYRAPSTVHTLFQKQRPRLIGRPAASGNRPTNTDCRSCSTLCSSVRHLLPVGNDHNLYVFGKRDDLLRGIAVQKREPLPLAG